MDKVTYKLLKKFYSKMYIKLSDEPEMYETLDDNVKYLKSENCITDCNFSEPDEDGFQTANGCKITILGMSYVENRKRNFWLFFLPYAITTVIAIANIVITVLALI